MRYRITGYYKNTEWNEATPRRTKAVAVLALGLLALVITALLAGNVNAGFSSPVPTPAPTLVPPVRSPIPVPEWPLKPPTLGDQPAPWVWGKGTSPVENENFDDAIRYVILPFGGNPFGLRHQDLGFD